eukprot:SAG31_NODE_5553_length_2461_cov_1.270957_3_plen_403_part_01
MNAGGFQGESRESKREQIDLDYLMDNAVPRMQQLFSEQGWAADAVTKEKFDELHMLKAELASLRLYTGPMYMLYNKALRAKAPCGKCLFCLGQATSDFNACVNEGLAPVRGQKYLQQTKERFVTTIHAVNSGLQKLKRLQPCCEIYRGLSGMIPPQSFMAPNEYDYRGGVEFGFSSTTLDYNVAKRYATGTRNYADDAPGLIYEMRMGIVNRGACLSWLSQYPHEKEILLPPLLAIEVLDVTELSDETIMFEMGMNCNMQSKTIEQVLAIRKEQCSELAEVVAIGVKAELERSKEGSISHEWLLGMLKEAQVRKAEIESKTLDDSDFYNDNEHFTTEITSTIRLVPKAFPELKQAIAIEVATFPSITLDRVLCGCYTVDPSAPTVNGRPHLKNEWGGHLYATK